MKTLLRYISKYKAEAIASPLMKLTEAAFELFVPLLVAAVIDKGVGGQDKGIIVRYALIMGALGLLGLLFSVTAQYFAAKTSCAAASDLRRDLFSKIQSFSYSQLDGIGSPTLITRLTSDINQVQSAVNLTLRLLLRSPFVVFGAMIMAFTVDARAALIFAIVIPVLFVVVFFIMLRSIPMYRRVQQALDSVLGKTRESLTGVRVIRAFCREEEETGEFDRRNSMLADMQMLVGRLSALLNPLTFLIVNAAVIVLVYTGGRRVEAGAISKGAVVALYNYMSQILVELVKLANLTINITKGAACMKRVESVLLTDSDESAPAAAPEGDGRYIVSMKNVSFRYEGSGADAVHGVSFDLPRGGTLGIIGGTGSGKTTLVNLICRFYEATGGEVYFDGKNVRSMPVDDIRRRVGVVPQKAVLFRGTIRDNLLFGCEGADEEAISRALIAAQAEEIVKNKADGLDELIEQGGKNLSGGQRQRLTIARALVRKPELLILDDSASALDFATDAALRKSLRELEWSPAVITVSQRTSSIMHCDRILVLDDGMPAGCGTHEQLLESCGVYREIYASQDRREAV